MRRNRTLVLSFVLVGAAMLTFATALVGQPALLQTDLTPVSTHTADEHALLEAAQTFAGTRNADWTPVTHTFPDDPAAAPMVLVPVGTFQMGTDRGLEGEGPIHSQTFTEPFWIDQTEVTRAQYDRCVEARVCTEPPRSEHSTRDNQPVIEITWFHATDYCAWRAERTGDVYRLPRENEWEYAARGVESWMYPWGNEPPNPDLAVYDHPSEPADVGSKPAGASWVGALDLSGNVWEWTSTIHGIDLNADLDYNDSGERRYGYPYDPDDGREQVSENRSDVRVIRGGSWYAFGEDVQSTARDAFVPAFGELYLGFRCVRDS